MRRRFPIIVPVLILMAALFLGGTFWGRNAVRQTRYGTNQQTRNFVGLNRPGTGPDYNMTRQNPTGIRTTPGTGYTGTRREISQQLGFDRQRADNLSKQLANIDGVRQINTIINGNTAIIGYTPAGTAANTNSTKRMITDKVKQLDNTITNVVVGSSADISTGIRRLWDNVKANKPVNDLNNDFNQLIKNINSGKL